MSSLAVIWTIAGNTLLETVRQRVFHFIVFLSALFIGGARFFQQFDFASSELKFVNDFGSGVLVLFGSILAIVVSAQIFFSEIENRTALTILAKPVSRTAFILGKFAGLALVQLIFVTIMVALLGIILFYREAALVERLPDAFEEGGLVRYGDLFILALIHWVRLLVVTAFTLLVCSYAQTMVFSLASSFLVLVICHIQYVAREYYERAEGGVGAMVAWLGARIFPNFQVFTQSESLVVNEGLAASVVVNLCGYASIYLIVYLALSIFSFSQREI